jgi:predicted Zn-dependent peptidase
LPPHGREEVVAALTSEKVAEWYARVIRRQLPVAIIVGDTDGSALVSSQIAEGFKRRDVETAIQVKTPPPSAASEKSELRRREQTTIAAGLAGPKAESADSAAFRLIESAMNGRAGRLSKALSDKRSFVSMVGVEDEPMFASGLIAAYIITPAESEQQARTALTIEFERLARDGLAADELENARALATTSYVNLLQSQAQHALQYARAIFYRRQAFDVDTYREQAGTVTVDNIKRIAATYLKASALSAGIVRGTPK